MESITINNQEIPLTFRRSKRARCLRLQIDNEGEITLVAPWLFGKRIINKFLQQHTGWIEKHLQKFEKQKKLRPKPKYQTGDVFYYFGEQVILDIKPSSRKRPTIKIRDNQMAITLHRDVSKTDGVAAIKKTIENFYKKKADEVIHDRLQFFNEHYGLKYKRVTMRNQKSRWGSCSRLKNLNFNWRLIMAPIEVIDYVVAHELCHIKEMNHSPKFWNLLTQTIPDYKERRKWLRGNNYLLRI